MFHSRIDVIFEHKPGPGGGGHVPTSRGLARYSESMRRARRQGYAGVDSQVSINNILFYFFLAAYSR